MARAINKLFAVIDTEIEIQEGFNKAIITKFYQNSSIPKDICANKNTVQKDVDGNEYRYQVIEIPITEASIINRKTYITDFEPYYNDLYKPIIKEI